MVGNHGSESVFTKTNCRCCSAMCAIVVESQGEQVLAVRGDPADTRSAGYLCPKGASLPSFHHQPGNVTQPRVNGKGSDWTTTLADIDQQLNRIADAYGREAIGAYLGNGTLCDTGGKLVGKLLGAIGTRQYYSALTVDAMPMFLANELVAGTVELTPRWVPEEPKSRLVLFLGINPAVSHGYGTMFPNPVKRIAAFRQRGGKVIVVDPRASRAAGFADLHVPIRPGTDPILLAWLVRELLIDGADRAYLAATTDPASLARISAALDGYDRASVAKATGLGTDLLDTILGEIREAGPIGAVCGTGITFGPNALVAEWLRWLLLAVTGSLDRRGGMWFNPGWLDALEQRSNPSIGPVDDDGRKPWVYAPPEGNMAAGPASRPELSHRFGQHPCSALVDEIEAGNIRALIVVGGSPLTSLPDPERTERALRKLEVLITIEIIETPVAAFATHVLPAKGQFERTDMMFETRTLLARPVVAPIGERRALWWILAKIGQSLNIDLFDGDDPDRMTDEDVIRKLTVNSRDGADALFAAGSAGMTPPDLYDWVAPAALPGGRWRITPPGLVERLAGILEAGLAEAGAGTLQLVGGRHLGRVNAIAYVPEQKTRDLPELYVHPDDAEARGLVEGDRVKLDSGNGQVEALITIDPTIRRGVVSLPHGFLNPNVGRLTSNSARLDPLVGQPVMTALPVSLELA